MWNGIGPGFKAHEYDLGFYTGHHWEAPPRPTTPDLPIEDLDKDGVDAEIVHGIIMGIGPVPAVRKVLRKAGTSLDDIELNEAFASQALYGIRELNMNPDKTNVNGGGISLGHPVGATGAILTVKLMEEMELRGDELGLVTMCVGGGQGVATIFQRTV